VTGEIALYHHRLFQIGATRLRFPYTGRRGFSLVLTVREDIGALGVGPALDNGGIGQEPDRAAGCPVTDCLLEAIVEELGCGHRALGPDLDEQLVV
jgi:hypothetical protein